MVIKLTPEEEAWLRAVAGAKGLDVEEMAHRILSSQLPSSVSTDPTLRLLEEWDREDATDDNDEIAARQREWDEFQNGVSARGLHLRKPE